MEAWIMLAVLINIILVVAAGVTAGDKNRNVIRWILLSLCITPVIALVFLWLIDEDGKKQERIERLSRRIEKLEGKEAAVKPCPLCGEDIHERQKFCQFCGGDVGEKEEENRKRAEAEAERRRWECEEQGAGILLGDESIMKEANMFRRMYGKNVYLSYLKGKAKELGCEDLDLTGEGLPL